MKSWKFTEVQIAFVLRQVNVHPHNSALRGWQHQSAATRSREPISQHAAVASRTCDDGPSWPRTHSGSCHAQPGCSAYTTLPPPPPTHHASL